MFVFMIYRHNRENSERSFDGGRLLSISSVSVSTSSRYCCLVFAESNRATIFSDRTVRVNLLFSFCPSRRMPEPRGMPSNLLWCQGVWPAAYRWITVHQNALHKSGREQGAVVHKATWRLALMLALMWTSVPRKHGGACDGVGGNIPSL